MRERGERPQEPVPAVPAKPKYTAPVNWWTLTPEERAMTLGVLREWVPELVRRYDGLPEQVVPPCWWRHEALIQELLGLFQYRQQQQVLESAPPGAMQDFHYQFNLSIHRLRGWVAMAGCTSATHEDVRFPKWADPSTPEHARWMADLDETIDTLQNDTKERKHEH